MTLIEKGKAALEALASEARLIVRFANLEDLQLSADDQEDFQDIHVRFEDHFRPGPFLAAHSVIRDWAFEDPDFPERFVLGIVNAISEKKREIRFAELADR